MRILPIDYGKERMGIAATGLLQIIANGLVIASMSTLFDHLKDYITREEVERIITGKPIQTNGKLSENMAWVEQFVNRQRKVVPQIPIKYYDECFTSVPAHKAILASGIGKKARQNKALVDEISATIILWSYMESKRLR